LAERESRAVSFVATLAGPLSQSELQEATLVSDRVRGELQVALENLRDADQPTLAFSRVLGVNRNICQRVSAGLDPRLDALTALTKLPGPEGLQLFASALQERAGHQAARSALTAAVESYGAFVRAAGGSQAGLIRRIEITARRDGGLETTDNVGVRKRMYEAATDLQGHSLDTLISIAAVRPMQGSAEFTEGLSIKGFVGLRAFAAPAPLVNRNFTLRHEAHLIAAETLHEPLAGHSADGMNLIEEFCSSPLPSSAFDVFDGGSRTIVEPGTDRTDPVDVVMGTRWRPYVHPTLHTDPRWWTLARIDRPIRRVVQDVYLHRSLAYSCVPAVGAYLWHSDFTGNASKDWHSRLPGRYTIEMLGAGTAQAATDAWHRHASLTSRMFQLAGWDPSEMVGYRCEVAYPIWASVLSMSFDFTEAVTRARESEE